MLRFPKILLFVLISIFLTACTSGSDNGAATHENPNTTPPNNDGFIYRGPPAATDDVQQFRLNLWDNIISNQRCGQCHNETTQQAPMFARSDDINLAYAAANTVVDLKAPSQSAMVNKLSGSHYCWEAQSSVCAAIIERWITEWANATEGGATVVELLPPAIKEPGSSRSFPANSNSFASTVYPVLRDNCVACHSENAATAQSPLLASNSIDTAYFAAQSKISLDVPNLSRLVVRLREDGHNCWSNCANDANTMEEAIRQFAGSITLSGVDPDHVHSKAMRLQDGIIASSGGRFEDNLIALYQFKTGSGSTAFDTSGIGNAMHLTLSGDYQWVGGWGISFNQAKAQAKVEDSKKLHQLITATGEYSLEAWVAPNNVVQEGPARIVSYSAGNNARNFMLGQVQYDYRFHHRSSNTDANGEPALSTPAGLDILQASLQHVVVTYDGIRGRLIYVNGELMPQTDSVNAGNFSDWDDSYAFVLGSETSNQHYFRGVIRMVAVHNRALTESQVKQNFAANVGERYLVLFNVSHLVNVPEAYIVFEVSQYDNYSYLFSEPFFISLDADATFTPIAVEGLRIGMNGKLPRAGQAFAKLNTRINQENQNDLRRIYLSTQGTVIALEHGANQDEFYLVFDQLGSHRHVIIEATPAPPAPSQRNDEQSDIGIKTFDEINASMARLTGIASTQPEIKTTFDRIRQQLPSTDNMGAFLASQQVGISQLAIGYCNALFNNADKRSALFPALDLSKPSGPMDDEGSAFHDPSLLISPLITEFVGIGFHKDPNINELQADLQQLVEELVSSCDGDCGEDHSSIVSKAVCTAVLASATSLLQ